MLKNEKSSSLTIKNNLYTNRKRDFLFIMKFLKIIFNII